MTNVTANNAASSITAGSTTSASLQSSGGGSSGLNGLTQADFIKLLTAQLQNQDPTSPTNPQDLANEFAELSTVSGINSLNQEVTQIGAGAGAAQIGQAATLIGKTVAVDGGSSVAADTSGNVTGAFSLPSSATNANVSIVDPTTGQVVHHIVLTNLSAGINDFSWNGGTAGKSYDYSVSAASGETSVAATTYTNGTVANVNLANGTPTLSLAGAAQPVDMSQIASIIGG